VHSWVSSREARRGLYLPRSVVPHRGIQLTVIKAADGASRWVSRQYPVSQRGMVSRILKWLTGINGGANLGGSIHAK